MRLDAEHAFPVASAVLAAFLAFHFATEHGPADRSAAALAAAPRVDTAALLALRLPVAQPGSLDDADPHDGVETAYGGLLTLRPDGLRFVRTNSARLLRPDSSLAGLAAVESVTFALAEPAPWGWRIARAGTPRPTGYLYFHGPGSELPRPDTLLLAGVGPLDLVGRWPVVTYDLVIKDRRTEELTRVQVFSRGDPALVEELLTPKPWEVGPGTGGR